MVKIFCSADLEELLGREQVRVAVADDLGRALDELAADRFLADDLGVVLGVGRVGHAAGDLQQHLVAANQLELVAEGQLIGQRDGVNGLPLAVQVADRPIDELVSVTIEILEVRNWATS